MRPALPSAIIQRLSAHVRRLHASALQFGGTRPLDNETFLTREVRRPDRFNPENNLNRPAGMQLLTDLASCPAELAGYIRTLERAFRPLRIILLRHGESAANANPSVWGRVPDHAIELTERGHEQAREAGRQLKELTGEQKLFFYVSPFKRTMQTFESIASHLPTTQYGWCEEPWLREQERGNYQPEDLATMEARHVERRAVGSFFYRFPMGESGADVYDRVTSFIVFLHRHFRSPDCPRNIVIITHGVTVRMFLMRWFHWHVDTFQGLHNPGQCQLTVLSQQGDPNRSYKIESPVGYFGKDPPSLEDFVLPEYRIIGPHPPSTLVSASAYASTTAVTSPSSTSSAASVTAPLSVAPPASSSSTANCENDPDCTEFETDASSAVDGPGQIPTKSSDPLASAPRADPVQGRLRQRIETLSKKERS